MDIAIFGTGIVGRTLAEKLVAQHHNVTIGTRSPEETLARLDADSMGNGPFCDWHVQHTNVSLATFAEAAAVSEAIVLATNGGGAVASLEAAGAENLGTKILLDLTNPLDFSQGMPPTLSVVNTDSLGEMLQRAFPLVRVVKTLNTVSTQVMVHPEAVAGGRHNVFLSGNDSDAKKSVGQYLQSWFGWTSESIIDLGDITTARGTEMYFAFWVRTFLASGNPLFNISIVR
jgi:8-hydroxy-5-deazaflavin:NADPH oxidoreductase